MTPADDAPRIPLPVCLAAWVALSLLAGGLVFGVADHGIHLAFQDMVAHPSRWSGDLLLLARPHHHSLFWLLQAPGAALLGLPAWTLALHLVVLVATGLAIRSLAWTLHRDHVAVAIALIALAVAWPAPGGARTLDPLLLNRGAALPLELFAVVLLLRRRPALACGLTGLAACIHVPSAAATASGLLLAWAVAGERTTRRERLAPLAAPLAALPVLLPWLLGDATEGLARVDEAWRMVLTARLPHHLLPSTWPATAWLVLLAWLALAGVALLRVESLRSKRRSLVALGAGLLGWAVLVGGVGGSGFGLALGFQLEPWQATRLLIVVAAVVAAGWIAERGPVAAAARSTRGPARRTALLLALLVGAWLLGRFPPDGRDRARLLPLGEATEEADLARALADATPVGTMIAVPPDRFESARWRTLRPLYVTWKDGGEGLFSRAVALEWRRRMAVASGCDVLAEPAPRGNAAIRARAADCLEGVDRRALATMLEAEGVDVLVLRATADDPPGPAPVLVQTRRYRAVRLSPP